MRQHIFLLYWLKLKLCGSGSNKFSFVQKSTGLFLSARVLDTDQSSCQWTIPPGILCHFQVKFTEMQISNIENNSQFSITAFILSFFFCFHGLWSLDSFFYWQFSFSACFAFLLKFMGTHHRLLKIISCIHQISVYKIIIILSFFFYFHGLWFLDSFFYWQFSFSACFAFLLKFMGTHHQLLKIIFIQLCAEQNSSNNFGQIKHQQFFSTASQ